MSKHLASLLINRLYMNVLYRKKKTIEKILNAVDNHPLIHVYNNKPIYYVYSHTPFKYVISDLLRKDKV